MKQLFERNYHAVVNRGLITDETTNADFLNKLFEETGEVNEAWLNYTSKLTVKNKEKMIEEIADTLIVCSNWLLDLGVNLEAVLTEIAEKNEKRAIQ